MTFGTIVIPRNWMTESTFAVLTWRATRDVAGVAEIQQVLTTALTEWVATTDNGRQAWLASGRDFNVGDLAAHTGDPSLLAVLAKYFIISLEVETYTLDGEPAWQFDDVLVREAEVGP